MPKALDVTQEVGTLIFSVRGHKVILDADLARLYGVPTRRLNEQVKRNADRFPQEFMFQLTREEGEALLLSRSQNATLKRGHNIKYLPRVFTEHGALNPIDSALISRRKPSGSGMRRRSPCRRIVRMLFTSVRTASRIVGRWGPHSPISTQSVGK